MTKPMIEVGTDRRGSELREMLLRRRSELLGNIRAGQSELRASSVERIEAANDSDPGLTSAPEAELDLLVIERRAQVLEQVNFALIKVEEGTYGQCEQCEEPIPLARLRALPFAVRCTRCQDAVEQRGRRAGRASETWDPADRGAR